MFSNTPLCRRLSLECPIIQAPMAGGGDTPDLVAAVGEAGGLGFIGAAYLTPEHLTQAVASVRAKTARPFGINLFAPMPVPPAPGNAAQAVERLRPYYDELGVAPPTPGPAADSFERLFPLVLESGAQAFSVTFGMIPPAALAEAKGRGMLVMATATTVEEAVALERSGVDAVIAQGAEAGGHRGTFAVDFDAGLVGTMALVPQVVDAVSIPVVASGGIMDGRGIAAALALGAAAVQMGTAFLTCAEAGAAPVYKDAILAAHEDATRITRAFSGRPARGIANRVLTDFQKTDAAADILPFPYQNGLTRAMRVAAGQKGKAEYLSLWCGQGARLARRQSAADLVHTLVRETEAAVDRLSGARN